MERDIQREVLLALGREPDAVFWRNNVGTAVFDRGGRRYRVEYGLARGSSDIIGCVAGRFVALEVKSGRGRPSPEQELYASCVRARGGFAAVVRSAEEAIEALQRARMGASC